MARPRHSSPAFAASVLRIRAPQRRPSPRCLSCAPDSASIAVSRRLAAAMPAAKVLHQRSHQPAAGVAALAARPPGLVTALAVGALVMLAALLAPEQPQDQAAICQRHNGSVACRVW
jgi:hypothetical protein